MSERLETYSGSFAEILAKPTMTVSEMGQVLGIGRRQAYEAVNRGDVPSIRLGSRILISTRVITQILESGSVVARVA